MFHYFTVINYNEPHETYSISSLAFIGSITEPKYAAEISPTLKIGLAIISMFGTFYYSIMMIIYEYGLVKFFRSELQKKIFSIIASVYNLFFMFTFMNYCFANFTCFDRIEVDQRICNQNDGNQNYYMVCGIYSVALVFCFYSIYGDYVYRQKDNLDKLDYLGINDRYFV